MRPDPDNLPHLPAFAASLIAADRRQPGASPRAREKVWKRTSRTLLAAGLLSPALAAAQSGAGALAFKLSAVAVVAAVAGGAGVGAVMMARDRVSSRPAEAAAPAPGFSPPGVYPMPALPEAPEVSEVIVAPPAEVVRAARPARPARPATPARDTFARERALIEAARVALGHREGQQVSRVLEQHARVFPNGLLTEEREFLRIVVAALNKEPGRARALAEGFRLRFPSSVFQDRVEQVLNSRR